MPTLPLYTVPPHPDAWHRVTAPGGYERWHFDAEDPAGRVRLVAVFAQGGYFQTDYLRRYARYRRRPTRHRPPVPGEYPWASFAVYEDGRPLGCWRSRHRPGEFSASAERPEVRIGPSAFGPGDGGSLRLRLAGGRLSADLRVRPQWGGPPHERPLLSGRRSAATHQWVLADPLCDVEGVIRIGGGDASRAALQDSAGQGSAEREIPFAGLGYHDHHYGTAPLGLALRWRVWGRILGGGRALAFHVAHPRDPESGDDAQLITADATGVRGAAVACRVDWGRGNLAPDCPSQLAFDNGLTLTAPRVLDPSPLGRREVYRVVYDARGGGLAGTAFCEVARPPRPNWPVPGRLIGWTSR